MNQDGTLRKRCVISGESFTIDEFERDFIQEISPRIGDETFQLPLPTLSPRERRRLRLSWRNLRHLFHRTCSLTGKQLISIYPAHSPFKVYHTDVWWSDEWDPMQYGRDYDFSQPFFKQFFSLMRDVPIPYRFGLQNENCEYINGAANCKDCYLCFNLDYCEKSFYLSDSVRCTSCIECSVIKESELCYNCIECERCYDVQHAYRSTGCTTSHFLFQCSQCRDCIGCVNLVGKEFYILNQKATKAEVEALRNTFRSRRGREQFKKKFEMLVAQAPLRAYFGHSNEESSGDNLKHCRDAKECFQCTNIEHARHCFYTFDAHHCVDLDVFGDKSSWLYQGTAVGLNCERVAFCIGAWAGTNNTMYSTFVAGSSNLFGCSGLRKKEYCILNKQYTKHEYEELLKKIIAHMQHTGEWGQFFPKEGSPFPYNHTIANDYFQLDAKETCKRGFSWSPIEKSVVKNIPTSTAPGSIDEVTDQTSGQTWCCTECKKLFRIDRHELMLRKECGIPLPLKCHDCRYVERHQQISQLELHEASCSLCGKEISTSHKNVATHQIFCEECFSLQIY